MIEHIRQLAKEERYSDAIKEIDRVGLQSPQLLVMRAHMIELSSDTEYPLEEIEECYRKALSLDPNYYPALLELGYYYLNVLDDAANAEHWFRQYLLCSIDSVKEGIDALEKVNQETAVSEAFISQFVGVLKQLTKRLDDFLSSQ